MYILSRLKETIKIEPISFSKDRETAIRDEINRKYTNKVLPDLGLCVALFDIERSSEGIILHGDGCIYHKIIFRLVVFKPFIDEVVLGKVTRSSREGIKISLGFFDDCWIPSYRLPANCAFDPARNEFYWVPPQDENDTGANIEQTPEDERFYIIAGETIRARVISEVFNDTTPKVPPKAPSAQAADAPPPPAGPPPYRLECSIQEEGLGLLDWWKAPAEEEGGEEAQEGEMS
ncbi:hypothetical protein P389DRAFT_10644 [Cystobasidium minutum MCA 4210]|uniref:uncharacterized protein n=1 Tax=Cystobasidium minutum MCA 4210 TaxID=1397322 RepID=UPI0034CFD1A0|eukprot:jgi/Rhomi1/10644/CE10643_1120